MKEDNDCGVDLGGGLHKIRMSIASKGKGKSGGARVITLTIFLTESYNHTPNTSFNTSIDLRGGKPGTCRR